MATYDDLIKQQYANIGRFSTPANPTGSLPNQIDASGMKYWQDQFASGATTPETFKSQFDNAVKAYQTDPATANSTIANATYGQQLTNDMIANNPYAGASATATNASNGIQVDNYSSPSRFTYQPTAAEFANAAKFSDYNLSQDQLEAARAGTLDINTLGKSASQMIANGTTQTPFNYQSPAGTDQASTQPAGGDNQLTAFGQDISGLEKGSYSGLPKQYNEQILNQVVPQLLESLKNYRSDIDQSTKASQELYGQMANEAMKVKAQDILNNLASRGVFKGGVASDAMGTGLADVAREYANKGFESSQAAAAMKTQEPSIFSQAANLGQTSESFNQLAPFEFLRDFYLGMQ